MTSINFRCASTDGYGDRDDIALARDKSWNNRQLGKDWRDTVNYGWAKSPESGEHIAHVVERMIAIDNMISCHSRSSIYFPELNDYGDDYTISDAVSEACINLGLSDEEFAPHLEIRGDFVDIRLQ